MSEAMIKAQAMLDGVGWGAAEAVPQLIEGVGHAVLALAQQQQVANRIALAQYELAATGRVVIHEGPGLGVLANPTDTHSHYRLLPDIMEALS